MTDTTYSGWTNRETWNAALWMGNQYGTYRVMVDLLEHSRNAGDLADSMEHVMGTLWGSKTPDGESVQFVNWAEIADSWWEDYDMAKN